MAARAARRPRAARSCRARAARDDRGSSTVEFAILFGVIVMLLFGGTQAALWYFGREAAQAAAEAGARAGSELGARPGSGVDAAQTYLAQVANGTLSGQVVNERDSATTVAVHIHASVLTVIPLPGFNPVVDVTVTRPREAFTTRGDAP